MAKTPSLFSLIRRELFSFWSLFWIFCISLAYITSLLFLLNYRFVVSLLSYPLTIKLAAFLSLFTGLFTAFSPLDTILTLTNALFFGINVVLFIKTLALMRQSGKLQLTVGGATLVGIISTGCTSCGFSLLSLFGLTSVSFLPFRGPQLHIIALLLLGASSWYMLTRLQKALSCRI